MQEQEETDGIEDALLEAKYVAGKIKQMVEEKVQVYDKEGGYRDIKYKDIVILLRTTKELSPIYEKEISDMDIPVFSDTGKEYLDSVEIQTITSLLKIIDNPRQDIPLVTVLRSNIGGFSDNDLIKIRLVDSYCDFYEALLKAKIQVEESIKIKIEQFLGFLSLWRQKERYLSLDELIWTIYIDTGYYNYVGLMPNGAFRQANLKMLFERAKEYEKASFKGLFHFIHFIEKLKVSSGDFSSAKLIGENEDVVRIMSIHKSKGLEFPVVFLCNTKKMFNRMDLNGDILLHQDIGIGPKYMNYERRIEYNTLAKEAIKIQMETEILSEELRLLYVALTRAKEKLIITGISKDYKKEETQKKELLKRYETGQDEKINSNIVRKFKTYLDWMELVVLNHTESIKEILEINIISKAEVVKNIKEEYKGEEIDLIEEIEKKPKEEKIQKKLSEALNWNYGYKELVVVPNKTSVSKIIQTRQGRTIKTHISDLEINDTDIILDHYQLEEKIQNEKPGSSHGFKTPKFLNEEEVISNAKKGTLVHMCLQRLNENLQYEKKDIQDMIEHMVRDFIITKKEADHISIEKILNFTKSTIWKELKQAKMVYKEKPFYINMPIMQILENQNIKQNEKYETEQILVQGIIDLYYINKQDQLILVDYKTDFVKNKQDLIDKYNSQLEIYKNALEEALGKKVEKIYIYSTYLNKEIEVIL